MGSLFEDFGKRLGEAAESVTNKAGEAMEIQKLKSQIRSLERENDNDLAELGLAVYDQFKDGAELSAEATGLCEAIQSREESIAECLQKISDVKGDFECEECGKTLGKGMAYCPYCGAKAPEIYCAEPEEEPEVAEEAPAVEEPATEEAPVAEEAAEAVENEEHRQKKQQNQKRKRQNKSIYGFHYKVLSGIYNISV